LHHTKTRIKKRMAIKNHLLKKYGISFERKNMEGVYLSEIYAYNLQDAMTRLRKFPELIHDYITDITIMGEMGVDIIFEKFDEDAEEGLVEDNLDWLFKYFQKDIIPAKEKEELKEFFLEKEYYEFLINF
jgi:hypothetical protein